jgi:WD40 repeat protein
MPDDLHVAVAGHIGTLVIVNLETGLTERSIVVSPGHRINWLSVTRDGRRIATASADGRIRIFDAESTRLLHTFNAHSRGGQAWGVDFSPDGRSLFTFGDDRTLIGWDLDTASAAWGIAAPEGVLFEAKYPDDHARVLVGDSKGGMHLWKLPGVR